MQITPQSTDQAVLAELGERLARARLARNLTQTALAAEAGVGKRTIERMESGESVQLTSFIRILRALDLTDRLDEAVPRPTLGPIARLELQKKQRRRASSRTRSRKTNDANGDAPPARGGADGWTWDE